MSLDIRTKDIRTRTDANLAKMRAWMRVRDLEAQCKAGGEGVSVMLAPELKAAKEHAKEMSALVDSWELVRKAEMRTKRRSSK